MASYGSQYIAYGAASPQQLEAGYSQKGQMPRQPFNPKQRARFTVQALCACLFFPWILFTFLSAVVTFSLHFNSPFLCWGIVAIAFILVLAIGALAVQKTLNEATPPFWLIFLFASSLLAVIGAPVMANFNFWDNMQPYYDLQTLAPYSAVSPRNNSGKEMMDAGTARFVKGSHLDLGKAYVFQHIENYCVAPISVGNAPQKSYDFWAVGLNCCNFNFTKSLEFKCGPYKSLTAREGVRLMSANQRNFFRLAVQQAEAAHRITAKHPIFFAWTEDANTDMRSYGEYGTKYFGVGVGAFFILQVFFLLVASILMSKLGY